jgi:hypothetical protein
MEYNLLYFIFDMTKQKTDSKRDVAKPRTKDKKEEKKAKTLQLTRVVNDTSGCCFNCRDCLLASSGLRRLSTTIE